MFKEKPKRKDVIVCIDVAGYNYYERKFDDELIKELDLNSIQVYNILSGKTYCKGVTTIYKK